MSIFGHLYATTLLLEGQPPGYKQKTNNN